MNNDATDSTAAKALFEALPGSGNTIMPEYEHWTDIPESELPGYLAGVISDFLPGLEGHLVEPDSSAENHPAL